MRCRSCNYALWNLTTRNCPECGAAFTPSEFEFTPGSVRFHCPRCNKAYYGTDVRGHLVPRAFNCVGCGTAIDMDEMALSPAQGLREDETAPRELPWVARSKYGVVRAFFKTCWWALARPGDLGRSIPVAGGSGAAFAFMLLVQAITWSLLAISILIIPVVVTPAGGRPMLMLGFGVGIIGFVAVTALIGVPLWALTAHAILRVTGRTRGGIGLTFSSIFYSAGANAPTAIPFIGYLFGPIWWLVSATITLKESQRVSGGRAALAVLPIPVLAAVSLLVAYVAGVTFAIRSASQAAAVAQQQAAQAAQSASDAGKASLLAAALLKGGGAGSSPDVLKLVADGAISPQTLAGSLGQTKPETSTISGVRLTDIPLMTADELQQLRGRLWRGQESGLIAPPETGFRLADCVFYSEKVNTSADPKMWLVVMWPDPRTTPVENAAWAIWVAQADGTVHQLSPVTFDAALDEQNALRAKAGLPSIRHPRDVK